jgi:hypothetical protein
MTKWLELKNRIKDTFIGYLIFLCAYHDPKDRRNVVDKWEDTYGEYVKNKSVNIRNK